MISSPVRMSWANVRILYPVKGGVPRVRRASYSPRGKAGYLPGQVQAAREGAYLENDHFGGRSGVELRVCVE
jgi:hypothetical protein